MLQWYGVALLAVSAEITEQKAANEVAFRFLVFRHISVTHSSARISGGTLQAMAG